MYVSNICSRKQSSFCPEIREWSDEVHATGESRIEEYCRSQKDNSQKILLEIN